MKILHPEWRASNAPIKFPFEDTASLTNDAGAVLFETTFLDAAFYVIGAKSRLYIGKITVSAESVKIDIHDDTQRAVASGSFSKLSPPDVISFTDIYNRPAGLMVSDSISLSIFSAWELGEHNFTADQTAFVARCCHAVPDVGVRGFLLDDGNIVSGDVWFVGDDGVVLSCDSTTERTPCVSSQSVTTLRVDIVGDTLFRRRLCSSPSDFETPRFLQSITFCLPGMLPSESSEESLEISYISSSSGTLAGAVDILFLTDTTGSMGDFLAKIRTLSSELLSGLIAAYPEVDFNFGIAEYRDIVDGPPFNDNTLNYRLNQAMTDDVDACVDAINTWIPNGGGDWPEGQMGALSNAARNWYDDIGGREDSVKIIVWSGDMPGHLNYGVYPNTLQEVIDTLNAKYIHVIGINTQIASGGINLAWDLTGGQNQADIITEGTDGAVLHDASNLTADQILSAMRLLIEDTILNVSKRVVRRNKITHKASTESQCVTCGPGDFGDIKLFVHTEAAEDTILRIRPITSGLRIDTVGERLEDLR